MTATAAYLAEISLPQMAGVVGFLFYVLGFAAVQVGTLNGNGIGYSLCNVCGAGLVLYSLTEEFNLPSALIQASFLTIGLVGVARRLRLKSLKIAALSPT